MACWGRTEASGQALASGHAAEEEHGARERAGGEGDLLTWQCVEHSGRKGAVRPGKGTMGSEQCCSGLEALCGVMGCGLKGAKERTF